MKKTQIIKDYLKSNKPENFGEFEKFKNEILGGYEEKNKIGELKVIGKIQHKLAKIYYYVGTETINNETKKTFWTKQELNNIEILERKANK